MNRKVQQDLARHVAIQRALAKKPTSQLSRTAFKPPVQNPNNPKKLVSSATRQIAKPQKAFRPQVKPELIDSPPIFNKPSIEYPTPDWFRSQEKADVSVIVPLYKSNQVIGDLVNSWDLGSQLKVEVIFIDDNCPANSKATVMQAWQNRHGEIRSPIGKIICNVENKGYGGASNTGARYATGDFLIFLNADTRVTPHWIEPIYELFQANPQIGIIGNLQLKDGGQWHGTIDGAGSQWMWGANCFVHLGRHCYQHKNLDQPMSSANAPPDLLQVAEREMVTGCCLAIRKTIFDDIGGFNANYRIGYWEDAEICLAVREQGHKVYFQPNSVIYHKLGHTHSGNHQHHDKNKQFFSNKWVNSGRIDDLVEEQRPNKPKVESMLIQRLGARGDVLMAAAVLPALTKKYPGCRFTFSTVCPEVLKDNPYLQMVLDPNSIIHSNYQVIYNLDLVYECRPNTNILKSYADEVGVNVEDCELFISLEPINEPLPENYVIIHSGKTQWVGRDWGSHNFSEIARRLMAQNIPVVCIGHGGDEEVPATLDLRGQTTIHQMATVISQARCFIGIDSLPMHIAQATMTPGVCFFGCISPELRLVVPTMQGIKAENLPCLGCHHRKIAPATVTNECETKNLDCIKLVTVDQMWAKIQNLLRS